MTVRTPIKTCVMRQNRLEVFGDGMLDQSPFQPIQVGTSAYLSLHLLTDCRANAQCTIDSCLGQAVVFHQVFDEKPVCALLTQTFKCS